MNTQRKAFGRNRRYLPAAFALIFFFATACDTTNVPSTQSNAGSLDAPTGALIDELDLPEAQARQFKEIVARYEGQPGRLWYISAELQQTLTDDQKDALIASASDQAPRSRGPGERGMRGRRGIGDGFTEGPVSNLTEEQRSQLKTLWEEHRTALEALREERRTGALSDEDFKTERMALREQMQESLAGVLTEEQLSEIEAFRESMEGQAGRGARRGRMGADRSDTGSSMESVRSAMIDALGLTPEQQEQLERLRESHRTTMNALRENARSEDVDRESIRETLESLRTSMNEAKVNILTDEQNEVVSIHRALLAKQFAARSAEAGRQGAWRGRRFDR